MYTLRDFISEISTNYGKDEIKQSLECHIHEFEKVDYSGSNRCQLIQQYEPLLELNDYVRVTAHTYYKLHKGYPSPRSLYPLRLFVAVGDCLFLTKEDWTGQFEFYRNDQLQLDRGDMVITYTDKYPDYYNHIKKTLLLLEMGHLLYNLRVVSKALGVTYHYVQYAHKGVILQKVHQQQGETDEQFVYEVKERSRIRNSGPYRERITCTSVSNLDDASVLQQSIEQELQELQQWFGFESPDGIKPLLLYNTGNGEFRIEDSVAVTNIGYQVLNELYTFVNFHGVSFCIFFLIKPALIRDHNATEYLLSLGYLTQSVCLKYANQGQYCRPIKSFSMHQVEQALHLDGSKYTPFYFLICGGFN